MRYVLKKSITIGPLGQPKFIEIIIFLSFVQLYSLPAILKLAGLSDR